MSVLWDDCYYAALRGVQNMNARMPEPIDEAWTGYVAKEVVEQIWEVLEDQIGTVQEKLLNDLTLARTELNAARSREASLEELVRDQAAELDRVRGTVGDNGEKAQ